MTLVKLLLELLHEALIEDDRTDLLADHIAFRCLHSLVRAPDQLRLQKHVLLIAAFELKVLRHDIRQVRANLYLHCLGN